MTIGIIANPASGKDIRRLVAQASVFDNDEKANIVRRVLRAIDALGGRRVVLMPDTGSIGARALDRLDLSLEVTTLDFPACGDARDSTNAARRMVEMGVGCIITLGGDGTNRAVARGSGRVPLLPISTGTNNVFSSMIEGTVAGFAALAVAERRVEVERFVRPSKRIDIFVDGAWADLALIDATVSRQLFVATRALWEPAALAESLLSRALPSVVGLASVGGLLEQVSPGERRGVYLRFGPGGRRVLAPLAPGLVVPIQVAEHRAVDLGEEISFEPGDCTLALDGEREIEIDAEQRVTARVSFEGPPVVDVPACLAEAARLGLFEQ